MDGLDIAYFLTIAAILVGGVICIIVFGSKEQNKRDELSNSYRFRKVNGEIRRAPGKPSLFERKKSYFYLEKAPFTVDATADGAVGADGKTYRAIAVCTVYISSETVQTAAESFFGMNAEEIGDMLAEPLETALKKVIAEYDGTQDNAALCESMKKNASAAVDLFGAAVTKVTDIRLIDEKN